MHAILLAAGYATRLYPLTKNTPKPLLKIGSRTILDRLVDRLEGYPEIQRMFLVSNAKFAGHFEEWARSRNFRMPVKIINDGTSTNETRLGAIADTWFALQRAGINGKPVYVLGTDNLPRFDPRGIIDLAVARKSSCVFACPHPVADLKRMGVAELDKDGRIVGFKEKPDNPIGTMGIPPFYLYTHEAVELIGHYLDEGNDPDAPGNFLEWLVARHNVYARVEPAGTHDIGTMETYNAVCKDFGEGA